MTHLKALIFDVDGTLAETERDGHRVAFNQTFQAAGLDWDWSEDLYGELLHISGGKERIRYFIEQYSPTLPEGQNWSTFIHELHQSKTERYTTLLQSGEMSLRPGVKRLIKEARASGVRLAIATTSRLENALALLKTALAPEAPTWFEVVAAGDIVPHKKPATDIYHYVLHEMSLPAGQCLAIEDTEHGLTAATGAELATVITVNSYTRHQDFAAAALVLDHLGEPTLPHTVLQGAPLRQPYFDLAAASALINSP